MRPRLARLHAGAGFRALLVAFLLLGFAAPAWAADPPPPGPPYPEPELNRAVYDYAGVFEDATIGIVESTIDEIENRTGAEIVVYTQVTGYGESTAEAEANAQALINQWGIGRRGFDDGMVILFDLDPTLEHGQVQLYAAEGFRAAFMTNDERQYVFDELMLPYLRVADLDSAILVAISTVAEYTSPEHAEKLSQARIADAILGLLVAPALFLGILGYGLFSWLRHGRDPVYLDDPSIHMPAPPAQLTAAGGAALMDGRSTRRALTAAMLDLASRGLISFREERRLLGLAGTTVGIDLDPPEEDPVTQAHRGLNARRPFGPAEKYALERLRALGSGGMLEADDLPKFGQHVSTFDERLEGQLVSNKWMAERPSVVTGRWRTRAAVALIGGFVLIVALGANLPSGGLMIVGGSLIASGIVLFVLAGAMPAVTKSGAMLRAMMHAYRRTLKKTMESARSMQQVVEEAHLDWLETPDQAVVWGTALGLQDEIEDVLKRSLQDVEDGRATASQVYLPHWYTTSEGRGFAGAGSGGGGLFSSSAIPNIGGMMAALGTIGNSPSSSGSGGGGGGFGGGSSGGGGGAGGGF